MTLGKFSHLCASVSKQYKSVRVKRQWCPMAGKVTVDLAIHHRLEWLIHLWVQWSSKREEHLVGALHGCTVTFVQASYKCQKLNYQQWHYIHQLYIHTLSLESTSQFSPSTSFQPLCLCPSCSCSYHFFLLCQLTTLTIHNFISLSLPTQDLPLPQIFPHRLPCSLRTDSMDFTTEPFLLSISVLCF